MTKNYEYQVALSFAGEDRDYVSKVATLFKVQEISVFYDEFEEAKLWGKDLYEYLDEIYREKAKYCIIFASKHYAKKLWPTHERKSAQERALKQNEEYILPARFDDTEIPGIRSTIKYIDLNNYSPEEFVELTVQKLTESKEATARQIAVDTIIYRLYLKPEPPIRANYQELKALSDASAVGYVDRDDYNRSDRWPDVLIFGASQKIQNGLSYNQSHKPYKNKEYDNNFKLFRDGSISFSETLKWENVEHLLFDADDFLENLVLFCLFSCQWLGKAEKRFNHKWTSATIAINALIPNGCLLHSGRGIFRVNQAPVFESLGGIKEYTTFDFHQNDDHDRLTTLVDRIAGFIFSEFSFKVRDQVDFPEVDIEIVKRIIERYSE